MRRILACLMTLLLALMGTARAEAPVGRYVETEVELPRGVSAAYRLDQNEGALALWASDGEGFARWTLDENDHWTREEVEWADAFTLSGMENLAGRLDMGWTFAFGESSLKVVRMDARGAEPLEETDGQWSGDIEVIGDNLVLVSGFQGGRSFGARTGKHRYNFEAADGSIARAGETLLALSRQDGCLYQYDLNNGETLRAMENAPGGATLEGETSLIAADAGAAYLANSEGIWRIGLGGSMWEKLVEGELTSLRTPSLYVKDMEVLDGVVYLLTDSLRLLKYAYDESVPTMPGQTLSIYTLYENWMIGEAATRFQQENPGWRVSVTNLMPKEGGTTREEVVRALNTELLAGKGPDVLLLDGLRAEDYIEKGVLADLGGVIQSLEGELLNNLFDPLRTDGVLYAAPVSVMLPVLIGQESDLALCSTLEGLIRAVEASPLEHPLPRRTREGFFDLLLPTSLPALLGADGAPDEAAMARLLEAVDALYARAGANESWAMVPWGQESEKMNASLGPGAMPMRSGSGFLPELVWVKEGKSMIFPMTLSGMNSLELSQMEQAGAAIAPMLGLSQNVFVPWGLVGVNARGQREAGEAFVRLLLSEPVQNTMTVMGGLTVNRRALERQIEEVPGRTGASAVSTTDPETGESVIVKAPPLTRATMERVYQLAQAATTPCVLDLGLMDMLDGALKAFFDGEMGPDEAARAACDKVRAYLAE